MYQLESKLNEQQPQILRNQPQGLSGHQDLPARKVSHSQSTSKSQSIQSESITATEASVLAAI
jgi:hypothetical protein